MKAPVVGVVLLACLAGCVTPGHGPGEGALPTPCGGCAAVADTPISVQGCDGIDVTYAADAAVVAARLGKRFSLQDPFIAPAPVAWVTTRFLTCQAIVLDNTTVVPAARFALTTVPVHAPAGISRVPDLYVLEFFADGDSWAARLRARDVDAQPANISHAETAAGSTWNVQRDGQDLLRLTVAGTSEAQGHDDVRVRLHAGSDAMARHVDQDGTQETGSPSLSAALMGAPGTIVGDASRGTAVANGYALRADFHWTIEDEE